MSTQCLGKKVSGVQCKKYTTTIFCHIHKNQLLEQKADLNIIHLNNKGIFPPDIESIIAEYTNLELYIIHYYIQKKHMKLKN
jgi:hypothetical protein